MHILLMVDHVLWLTDMPAFDTITCYYYFWVDFWFTLSTPNSNM